MKHLDEPTLLKLHKKMLRKASMMNHPLPNDIASEYVTRLLEGYHQRATIDQAYVDICRLTMGRKGQPGYKQKLTLQMVPRTEEQNDLADSQESVVEGLTIDEILDLEKKLSKIKCERTKEVFMMILNGWTQKEICKKLDLTESRVSQIVNRQIESLAD